MKKNIVLAVIATAAMALSLVGCGVKVTNISVPDAATLEKGESITLPVNFGTEDAPAETPVIATGESATAETAAQDEKIAKAAEKLTLAWTSSDESVATVDETGTVTAVAAGEAEITAAVKDTEMQDVCVICFLISAILMLASAYFCVPVLILNYAFCIRSNEILVDGFSFPSGIVYALALSLLCMFIGRHRFRNFDLY